MTRGIPKSDALVLLASPQQRFTHIQMGVRKRFKSSAAKAAVDQSSRRRVADASRGLIQVVADNFDANISSQNGLISTHSLAMLLAFKEDASELHTDDTTIRRLTREEMKLPVAEDIAVQRYRGQINLICQFKWRNAQCCLYTYWPTRQCNSREVDAWTLIS